MKDDSIEGIYDTLRNFCAMISKTAGGITLSSRACSRPRVLQRRHIQGMKTPSFDVGQAIKPMRAASTRRKNTIKQMPTVKEGLGLDIQERGGPSGGPLTSSSPCVAGESRAALDMLFETG
jgi:hypothetical protein